MTANKLIALVTIASLGLCAAATDRSNKPVERPFLTYANAVWTIDPATGDAATLQTGVANLLGDWTMTGVGHWDLQNFTVTSCSGSVTAANGDLIFFECGGEFEVTVTGGTGRFEGATGGLNTTWQSEPTITVDPVTGLITIELTYTAAGTLTY